MIIDVVPQPQLKSVKITLPIHFQPFVSELPGWIQCTKRVLECHQGLVSVAAFFKKILTNVSKKVKFINYLFIL